MDFANANKSKNKSKFEIVYNFNQDKIFAQSPESLYKNIYITKPKSRYLDILNLQYAFNNVSTIICDSKIFVSSFEKYQFLPKEFIFSELIDTNSKVGFYQYHTFTESEMEKLLEAIEELQSKSQIIKNGLNLVVNIDNCSSQIKQRIKSLLINSNNLKINWILTTSLEDVSDQKLDQYCDCIIDNSDSDCRDIISVYTKLFRINELSKEKISPNLKVLRLATETSEFLDLASQTNGYFYHYEIRKLIILFAIIIREVLDWAQNIKINKQNLSDLRDLFKLSLSVTRKISEDEKLWKGSDALILNNLILNLLLVIISGVQTRTNKLAQLINPIRTSGFIKLSEIIVTQTMLDIKRVGNTLDGELENVKKYFNNLSHAELKAQVDLYEFYKKDPSIKSINKYLKSENKMELFDIIDMLK